MKATFKSIIAMMLVVFMAVSMFAACDSKPADDTSSTAPDASTDTSVDASEDVSEDEYTGADTLVVGYDPFSEKFSPFFAKTSYDQDVAGLVSIGLLNIDREGNTILLGKTGEKHTFNGTEYSYDGIADCVITQNDDGTVVYEFTLREDVKFSDGEILNVDDVIFSMYVLADPTYDGSSTFYTLPIVGMEEYRSGMESVRNIIAKAGKEGKSELVSEEDTAAFWAAVDAAGPKFAQEIVDYCIANGYGTDVATAAPNWGYDGVTTVEEFWQAIVDNMGVQEDGSWDFSANGIDYESAGTSIMTFIDNELGDKAANLNKGVNTGDSAANISGIEKTGDFSFKVTTSKFDAVTITQLGITVAPLHYYGDAAKYDYAKNMFGFPKGDISSVKDKTTKPMGAGPYKFVGYENGVVSFVANENYYKGAPKITNIKFQEITTNADKVAGITTGTLDISAPDLEGAIIESIKKANNGNLTGDVITYQSVDFLGYGYIGICATTVKVGDDIASDASKNLRKAFSTLFSVYRDTVIDSYYGDRASVINYPISNTSWAAPKPADEGYAIAYSKDVEGKAIFTSDMTTEQKVDAAVKAAIGFLKAAGYTWDDAAGKFTAAPEGASLSYEFIIPADGKGDHPSYNIVTSAKEQLEKIGLTLNIYDPSNSQELWDALESGSCNMWAAAWSAGIDPDMYQVYHSSNIFGLEGSTESNHYGIQDADLDKYIMDARTSADNSYRKTVYKACLDIILDWGVEIPVYQRQECTIFSSERIDVTTLTPDITTYWSWMQDIEGLEMLPAVK